MESSHPLHHCHVHKVWAILNRIYILLQILALAAIFYYRGAFFLSEADMKYYMVPFLPWLVILTAELVLAFIWLLRQSFYWRPVTRTVFPENLPKDEELPGIDVFICTADPIREPTFDVMNTVVSAMSLDYPAEKLHVYLSDDGGASVTLEGMKEAWVFATWWLPFCRRYDVKPTCPQAYFQQSEGENSRTKFIEDRKLVQEKYEAFKKRVQERRDTGKSSKDHPAYVQVIDGDSVGDVAASLNPELMEMPLLVYIAREKRPSYPHHFKAGALNALLRVSSILSNSPYILVLDCDMYCNDSISARQAMCFFLDPKISPSLGWLQYPQKFHNISESDIYDSQFRTTWTILWPGVDGLQGPLIIGTNFYIKRKALYGYDMRNGTDLMELRRSLGQSNELMKSFSGNDKPKTLNSRGLSAVLLQEADLLASCAFEKDTKWGAEVGFWYDTIVEDVFTGLFLQSKGWRSVYLNPPRPPFLGSATTNFDDIFGQSIRWYAGFIDIVLSKYFPLINSPSKTPLLQKMSNAYLLCDPLHFFPILCYATIPPICFLYGIPLYPKVSDPFFKAFAFAYIASLMRHLFDIFISGESVTTWLSEQRIWIIKSFTCHFYGTLECVFTRLGFREASFTPTNKAGDDDKNTWYYLGKYDFRTSNMFLVPLVTAVTLNIISIVGGVARVIVARNWDRMFSQVILSFYVLIMSLPVIEGMFLRQDSGRVPSSSTLISAILSVVLLGIGYLIL